MNEWSFCEFVSVLFRQSQHLDAMRVVVTAQSHLYRYVLNGENAFSMIKK